MTTPLFADIIDKPIINTREILEEDFTSFDMGMYLNRTQGHTLWKPGEVMQYEGTLNGVRVHIERARGRMGGSDGRPMFRVAFGDNPEYPSQIEMHEAFMLIVSTCYHNIYAPLMELNHERFLHREQTDSTATSETA